MADNQGKPGGRDGAAVPAVVDIDTLNQGKLEGRDLWGPGIPTRKEIDAWNAAEREEYWTLEQDLRAECGLTPPTFEELREESLRKDEERRKLYRKRRKPYWKSVPATLLDEVGIDYGACPIVDGEIRPPPPGRALDVPYRDEHENEYVQPPYTRSDGREFPAIPAVRRFVLGKGGGWDSRWPTGYQAKKGPPYTPLRLAPPWERVGRAAILCEGESDTLAAGLAARDEDMNVDAVGVPGASMLPDGLVDLLRGYGCVYLGGDGDKAGREMNAKVARALQAVGVETRVVPVEEGKDIRDTLDDGIYLSWMFDRADELAASGEAPDAQTSPGSAAPPSRPSPVPAVVNLDEIFGPDAAAPPSRPSSPSSPPVPAGRLDAQQTAEALGDATRLSDGSRMARCPAHNDTRQSLHLTDSGDKLLVHCFGGCSQDAVIDALRELGLWGDVHDVRQAATGTEAGSPAAALPATPEERFAAHVRPVVDTDPERLPALLTSDCGTVTIIYTGKTHIIHGKPGTGKTWDALLAAMRAVRVLWCDFDDKPATLARRAALLDADNILDSERTKYVDLSLFEDPVAIIGAQNWIAEGDPEGNLVILDSAERGGCLGDVADVAEWFEEFVKPWEDMGVTVIIIDHAPKSDEHPTRGPIGSQFKLARVDGAAILVEGTPWTKSEPGQVDLIVHKDRPGDMPAAGNRLATIIGDYDEHGAFRVSIVAPGDKTESNDLERAVLQSVHDNDGFDSTTALTEKTEGRHTKVRAAADRLADRGLLERTGRSGRGTKWRITDAGKDRLEEGRPSPSQPVPTGGARAGEPVPGPDRPEGAEAGTGTAGCEPGAPKPGPGREGLEGVGELLLHAVADSDAPRLPRTAEQLARLAGLDLEPTTAYLDRNPEEWTRDVGSDGVARYIVKLTDDQIRDIAGG